MPSTHACVMVVMMCPFTGPPVCAAHRTRKRLCRVMRIQHKTCHIPQTKTMQEMPERPHPLLPVEGFKLLPHDGGSGPGSKCYW